MNELMTELFVEQPVASPGPAKKTFRLMYIIYHFRNNLDGIGHVDNRPSAN